MKWRKGWIMSSATSQRILQVRERLENELCYVTAHSPSEGKVGEWALLRHSAFSKWRKGWRMSSATSQLILQPFRCFTYATAHSVTLFSLFLRHRLCSFCKISVPSPTSQSFSNSSVASPSSHLILQPFFHFSYVTSSSLNSPGEPHIGWNKDK